MSTRISGGRSKNARDSAHRHLARLRAERAARRAGLRSGEAAAEPGGATGASLGPGAWMPDIRPSAPAVDEPEAKGRDEEPTALRAEPARDDPYDEPGMMSGGHDGPETSPQAAGSDGNCSETDDAETSAEPGFPDVAPGPEVDDPDPGLSVAEPEESGETGDQELPADDVSDGMESDFEPADGVAESVPPETGDHDAVDGGSVDAVVIGAAGETFSPAVAIEDPEPQQAVVEDASSGHDPESDDRGMDAEAYAAESAPSGIWPKNTLGDQGLDNQISDGDDESAAADPDDGDITATGQSATETRADEKPTDAATDLYELPGAGDGLVWLFGRCGVRSLADLAVADPAQLAADLGLVAQILDIGYWIEFARKRTTASAD